MSVVTVWTGSGVAAQCWTAERLAALLPLLTDPVLHRVLPRPGLLELHAARVGESLECAEKCRVSSSESAHTGTGDGVPLVEQVAHLALVARGAGQAAGDHAVGRLLSSGQDQQDREVN